MYVDLLNAAMFNAAALSASGFFAQCQQLLVDVEGLLAQAQQLRAHAAVDVKHLEAIRDKFHALLGRAHAHVQISSIHRQIQVAIYEKVQDRGRSRHAPWWAWCGTACC